MSAPFPRLASSLLPVVLAVIALAACGGDAEPEQPAPPPVPSEGVHVDADALLVEMAERLAQGKGNTDPAWSRDVQVLAMALWPAGGASMQRTHSNLALIAGDVASDLAASPDAEKQRADWQGRDPESLVIHDAVLAALARGAAGYAAWVETEGVALIRKRLDALSR